MFVFETIGLSIAGVAHRDAETAFQALRCSLGTFLKLIALHALRRIDTCVLYAQSPFATLVQISHAAIRTCLLIPCALDTTPENEGGENKDQDNCRLCVERSYDPFIYFHLALRPVWLEMMAAVVIGH